MRKTHLIFSTLVLLLAGLLSFSGCTVSVCGNGECESGETAANCPADCIAVCDHDGTCDAGETAANCPADCGAECGNDICETGETAANCPADCTAGGASVSFVWYIHHIQGGVNVGFGSGTAQEVCALVQAVSGISAPPVVQLWEDTNNDNVAEQRFDFTCSAGEGLTTEEWATGDTIKFAFALVDGAGTLLSQSPAWDTQVLAAGVNDLGTVDYYVGDYGPLNVDLVWADKMTTPAFSTCALLEPTEVSVMGYLLSYSTGDIADEVDIDTDPTTCHDNLTWDIIDFDTYTLVLDGEDTLGTTIWGSECQNLIVDSRDVGANEFTCQVVMTASP